MINFLDKRQLAPYWVNTSSNSLAGSLIRRGSKEIKEAVEELLNGKVFHTQIDEQIVFSQLDEDETAVWSLLLAAGYLKIFSFEENESWGETECSLALTNHEVHTAFRKMIRGWFSRSRPAYSDFIKALLRGDQKSMNAYMNQIASAVFSFFDTGKKASAQTEPERFYHGFVLGLLVELEARYTVTSNRESGFGRYDVIMEPKNSTDDGMILEFKVHEPEEEKTLQHTANAALKQICWKEYAAVLEQKGIPKSRIRVYGYAFEGKKVLIDGGALQTYQ